MKTIFFLISTIFILFSSTKNLKNEGVFVKDNLELTKAIDNAGPGDEIIMANGTWNDIQIRFVGYGKENQPISLRAETAGKVILSGKSDLKLGGEYLEVSGLYFTNGASPSDAVIEFAINQDTRLISGYYLKVVIMS